MSAPFIHSSVKATSGELTCASVILMESIHAATLSKANSVYFSRVAGEQKNGLQGQQSNHSPTASSDRKVGRCRL